MCASGWHQRESIKDYDDHALIIINAPLWTNYLELEMLSGNKIFREADWRSPPIKWNIGCGQPKNFEDASINGFFQAKTNWLYQA